MRMITSSDARKPSTLLGPYPTNSRSTPRDPYCIRNWGPKLDSRAISSAEMIRIYADADTEDLLDVWYRASLIAHPFLSEKFRADERTEIVQRWLPIAETTVYETEGRVVGFIALIGNEVGAIFVDPEYQGRGIGRALMSHARSSRGVLELDVFEANSIGRGFYDALGFEVIGRHLNQEAGQYELRLRLG